MELSLAWMWRLDVARLGLDVARLGQDVEVRRLGVAGQSGGGWVGLG